MFVLFNYKSNVLLYLIYKIFNKYDKIELSLLIIGNHLNVICLMVKQKILIFYKNVNELEQICPV
jgi:hypothetical protein